MCFFEMLSFSCGMNLESIDRSMHDHPFFEGMNEGMNEGIEFATLSICSHRIQKDRNQKTLFLLLRLLVYIKYNFYTTQ